VSTPANELTPAQATERAAALAEMASNALYAARSSLANAAEVTDMVDRRLRGAEHDIASVAGMASRVRYAETAEDAEPILRQARQTADEIHDDLRRGRRGVGEVRDYLAQGAREIAAGRSFLDELDSLPGRRSETNDQLRHRLAALDRAVQGAMEGVDRTDQRLVTARQNLEPLLNVPGTVHDQARTAAVVQEAGSEAERAVGAARQDLGMLREDVEYAEPDAKHLAHDSSELAVAIRAGTNPTPPSARTTPGASPEDPRRAWSEGRDLGQGLNR
jgi:ABC-type transporter Mla subunit MlaD